jgi:ferredoxin
VSAVEAEDSPAEGPTGEPKGPGESSAGPQRVVVDNGRCHLYGVCAHEAPGAFELGDDGRLRYDPRPETEDRERVRQAARLCPAQAIEVTER